MGRFEPEFPVELLRPAAYNPRAIDETAREDLKRSIRSIGFAKPVIVLEDGLTIAGHQRGNAARALGLSTVPAFVLAEVNEADEIRFNQLHNGTDLDECDPMPTVLGEIPPGFSMVDPGRIDGDTRATGVPTRAPLMRLLLRYGNWGGAIVSSAGEVLAGAHYLLGCKQLRMDARVYGIEAERREDILPLLRRRYGVFSYEHLDRTPWRQSFAQPNRLSGGRDKQQNSSKLYENFVIPELVKGDRLLDFGSGRGAYPRRLRMLGHSAWDIEFFRRARGSNRLDKAAVHGMIDRLVAALDEGGRFDRVVCEAVINSVDRPEAEVDVLTCCAAFCRHGGSVYFSGRSRDLYDYYENAKKYANKRADWWPVAFLDDNGMSATYHRGGWFYQKFHRSEEADELARSFGEHAKSGSSTSCWQRVARRTVEPDPERVALAIRREFDLAWPDGESVGRGDDVLAAWQRAVAAEG